MLELKNICFSAEEDGVKKDILKDVSLTIDERFVAITGPNGGGKSTLIKIIAGVLEPTSGQILFNGVDITHMSITERARLGVSYAFQQPVRFKGITVFDLITLASGRTLTIAEACEYLSEVGMCARDYVNREVNGSLSGGELKRIEIATPDISIKVNPERSDLIETRIIGGVKYLLIPADESVEVNGVPICIEDKEKAPC